MGQSDDQTCKSFHVHECVHLKREVKVFFQTEREMVKKIDLKVGLDGLMIKIPA